MYNLDSVIKTISAVHRIGFYTLLAAYKRLSVRAHTGAMATLGLSHDKLSRP